MGDSAKNIAIILGIITIGIGGYWLYSQQVASVPDFASTEKTMQNMLNRTQVFIERRQQLEQVALDISFFQNESFQSLTSYSTDISSYSVGRTNPFAETEEITATESDED